MLVLRGSLCSVRALTSTAAPLSEMRGEAGHSSHVDKGGRERTRVGVTSTSVALPTLDGHPLQQCTVLVTSSTTVSNTSNERNVSLCLPAPR